MLFFVLFFFVIEWVLDFFSLPLSQLVNKQSRDLWYASCVVDTISPFFLPQESTQLTEFKSAKFILSDEMTNGEIFFNYV